MAPAVVTESLTKRFGALVAVDDLSFAHTLATLLCESVRCWRRPTSTRDAPDATIFGC
jgi:hypothetical protein